MARKSKARPSSAARTEPGADYAQRTDRIKAWATVISALGGLGGLGGLAVYMSSTSSDSPAEQGQRAQGNRAADAGPGPAEQVPADRDGSVAPPAPVVRIRTSSGEIVAPADATVVVSEQGGRTITYCPPGNVLDSTGCHPPPGPAARPTPPQPPADQTVPGEGAPPLYAPFPGDGAPAPPEPSPPPPACVAGPFMVFFDWDEDDVTPQAASILDNAASSYQMCGQAQVMIAGHTDRSGAAQYNVGLSHRRTANVRSYLVGRGIPDGVMTAEGFGESRPLVDTADGAREPQNRRVEITFGPGSGW